MVAPVRSGNGRGLSVVVVAARGFPVDQRLLMVASGGDGCIGRTHPHLVAFRRTFVQPVGRAATAPCFRPEDHYLHGPPAGPECASAGRGRVWRFKSMGRIQRSGETVSVCMAVTIHQVGEVEAIIHTMDILIITVPASMLPAALSVPYRK